MIVVWSQCASKRASKYVINFYATTRELYTMCHGTSWCKQVARELCDHVMYV